MYKAQWDPEGKGVTNYFQSGQRASQEVICKLILMDESEDQQNTNDQKDIILTVKSVHECAGIWKLEESFNSIEQAYVKVYFCP